MSGYPGAAAYPTICAAGMHYMRAHRTEQGKVWRCCSCDLERPFKARLPFEEWTSD